MTEGTRIIDFNPRLLDRTLRENAVLKRRLEEILDTLRYNDKVQEHFDQLERIILESRTMQQMVRSLVTELKKRFDLEQVSLALIIPDSKPILPEGLDPKLKKIRALVTFERERIHSLIPPPFKPFIGEDKEGRFQEFFRGKVAARIRSKAIVPMLLRGEMIGTLNLGSRDPGRYNAEQGTKFLQRLAGKIALAIDNVLTHQRLLEASITDRLTGLFNRRYLDSVFSIKLQSAKRYGTALSCIMIDLDGFKQINDRFGHALGDQVLIHIAGMLRGNCRSHDIVGRFGGDEFIILLPHTQATAARKVAEKLKKAVAASPFADSGRTIPLSISTGVASFPHSRVSAPKDLIEIADRNLYRSKRRS